MPLRTGSDYAEARETCRNFAGAPFSPGVQRACCRRWILCYSEFLRLLQFRAWRLPGPARATPPCWSGVAGPAGEVPDEPAVAERLRAAAPERVEVRVVPGAGHTGGLATAPEEWRARVLAFLDAALNPGG